MVPLDTQVGNNAGTNYGSISPDFGSTNVDNIPSSGGYAGYTSAIVNAPPSAPSPVPNVTASLPNYGADGSYSTVATTPAVNPSQSGDLNSALFQQLIDLYGNQFAAPTAAQDSGTGIVVVPEAGTNGGAATTSAPSMSGVVGLIAIAGVAYLGYRWYKGRAK